MQGRTYSARYDASEKGRASKARRRARYEASEKGRAAKARSNASEKGRASKARYTASEKGRAAQERYNASEKGRARQARYTAGGIRTYAGGITLRYRVPPEKKQELVELLAAFRASQRKGAAYGRVHPTVP